MYSHPGNTHPSSQPAGEVHPPCPMLHRCQPIACQGEKPHSPAWGWLSQAAVVWGSLMLFPLLVVERHLLPFPSHCQWHSRVSTGSLCQEGGDTLLHPQVLPWEAKCCRSSRARVWPTSPCAVGDGFQTAQGTQASLSGRGSCPEATSIRRWLQQGWEEEEDEEEEEKEQEKEGVDLIPGQW